MTINNLNRKFLKVNKHEWGYEWSSSIYMRPLQVVQDLQYGKKLLDSNFISPGRVWTPVHFEAKRMNVLHFPPRKT